MIRLVLQERVRGCLAFVQRLVPDEPNGHTLLLLHTAGQSGVQWRYAAPALAALGYEVLVPDLPGHGHTEPMPGGPVRDLGVYSDWLVDLLHRIHPHPVIPVGCSIGGKISQDLVTRHPEVVTAAVSMCAESGNGRVKLHALERELRDVAAPSRTDRTHLGTRAVVGRATSPDTTALIARMHCREDPAVSNSDLIGWGTHDVRDLLPRVTRPVTFVAGTDDLWVDVSSVARSADRVQHGTFVQLDGVGHYPMEELPEFAAMADGWISLMLKEIQ